MSVTSGKQWRKAREEGIEVRLSWSGNVVAIRPIDIDFFIHNGGMIPSVLSSAVQDVLNSKETNTPFKPPEEVQENNEEWIRFLDTLVTFAFVNPKVVETPQSDDEISIADVSYRDKLDVYATFTRSARWLEAFHQEQIKLLASVGATEDNGPERQHDTGRKRVGVSTDRSAAPDEAIA